MQNSTVGFGCTAGNIRLFFKQNTFYIIPGKFAQNCTAYNTAANNAELIGNIALALTLRSVLKRKDPV